MWSSDIVSQALELRRPSILLQKAGPDKAVQVDSPVLLCGIQKLCVRGTPHPASVGQVKRWHALATKQSRV